MDGDLNTAPAALDQVSTPAILLMVIAGLGLAGGVFSIVVNTAGMAIGSQMRESQAIMNLASGAFGIAMALLSLMANAVILFGAMKMKRLQSFGLSMTAAILALVPCMTCCCLGLPVGIWALVVLNKPEVKGAFSR